MKPTMKALEESRKAEEAKDKRDTDKIVAAALEIQAAKIAAALSVEKAEKAWERLSKARAAAEEAAARIEVARAAFEKAKAKVAAKQAARAAARAAFAKARAEAAEREISRPIYREVFKLEERANGFWYRLGYRYGHASHLGEARFGGATEAGAIADLLARFGGNLVRDEEAIRLAGISDDSSRKAGGK